MAENFFTDLKITDNQWNQVKVAGASVRPNSKTAYGTGLTPEDTKKIFDKGPELIKDRFNLLVEYAAIEEGKRIAAEKERAEAETARVDAEIIRENREMDRMDAERTRYENEQIRVQNEQARGAVTNAMLEGLDNLLTLQQIYIDKGGAGV